MQEKKRFATVSEVCLLTHSWIICTFVAQCEPFSGIINESQSAGLDLRLSKVERRDSWHTRVVQWTALAACYSWNDVSVRTQLYSEMCVTNRAVSQPSIPHTHTLHAV